MATANINDGVLPYLNATAGQHNGKNAAEFLRLNSMRKAPQDGFTKVTVQGMASWFGVHRHTMQDWIARYNKENHA